MNSGIPEYISAIFLSLVVILLFLMYAGLRKALLQQPHSISNSRYKLYVTISVIIAWLLFLAILASKGFFTDFQTVPPRFPIALLVPAISIIVIASLKSTGKLLEKIPQAWLIFPQSFRILMEIILWLLFIEHVIPVQMTFEGYNWDIIAGITALPAGYFALKKGRAFKKWILVWNIAGLLLLANILTIAILSIPTPFRQFMNEPANTMVAYFPFIWLPGFVVPFAILLHVLSIKKALGDKELPA